MSSEFDSIYIYDMAEKSDKLFSFWAEIVVEPEAESFKIPPPSGEINRFFSRSQRWLKKTCDE